MSEPLCTWTEPIREEWIDYNGHLSEPFYVMVFGHATDEVMATLAMGPAEREARGDSLYTVEAHVRYLDQVSLGEQVAVRSWVIGATGKLLWIWHEMWAGERLRASEEVLGVHVTHGAGGDESSPFPAEVQGLVDAALTEPGPDASRRIALRVR